MTALPPLHDLAPVAATGRAAEPLLALNNVHAEELSFHTPQSWTRLVETAFFARRIGVADAFLLAFDQDGDYGSPNFLWFRDRFPRFVYVDRVVTALHARGRGLARTLYKALFSAARAAGHETVCCEVNLLPPNPGSDAFHAALGFAEVGRGAIHGGAKTVRYLSRALETPCYRLSFRENRSPLFPDKL